MTPARRIRVLWVVKGLGPGGAERLLVAAATARDQHSFDIDCAYALPWKDHLVDDLERAGVRTICVGDGSTGRFAWPSRLVRLVRSGGYDVIHVHSPLPGSVARLAARSIPSGRRPATMSTEHNTWGTHRPATRLANRLTSTLDRRTFAVTAETLGSMSGPARRRATVLQHGIDTAGVAAARDERARVRAELGLPGDAFVIVTVANFRPQKDYPNLLAAARQLLDRGVDFRLVIVGQGPQEAETRQLSSGLGLDDVVTFTGFRNDAVSVMAAADCFVLASAWEGLPVALMEAFALGLPVVATSVGGIAETLTDGVDGVLVPPGDANALADALELVIDDDELRSMLGSASAALAPGFDVSRAQRTLEDSYRRLAPELHAPEGASPHQRPGQSTSGVRRV